VFKKIHEIETLLHTSNQQLRFEGPMLSIDLLF